MSAIKRKIELAYVAYLAAQPELAGVTVLSGSEDNEATTPFLTVFASDESNHSSLPFEAGVRSVKLSVEYQDNVGNNPTRAGIEAIVSDITCFLDDIEATKLAINKQIEPDTRPVVGMHVYYASLLTHQSSMENDMYIEGIDMSITCSVQDAF